MSIIVRFPSINPYRFAEVDAVFPGDRWGYPAFGDALQIDATRPGQVREQYYQKLGLNDPVYIHYHRGRTGDNTNITNPSELRIFEVGSNALLKVVNLTSSYMLSGVVDEVTGEQLYTEQFLFTPASIPELAGKKYIYFDMIWYFNGVESILNYRSNPIFLSASHPGTSLVEYNQLVNGHDVLFEQLMPRFAYRIESNGMIYEPGGDYTTFEDQDRNTVTLDAEAYNVFKWDIGGYIGLPECIIDVVNRSLQCCKDGYFRIDGKEYIWQDGKLERSGSEDKHVQWRTVTLRQKDGNNGYTFTQRKIKLFTTVDFPFAINHCVITDNFTTVGVLNANGGLAKVFDDSAGLDSWIGSFNTNIAGTGHASVIERNGNDVFLVNAPGERFYHYQLFPFQIYPNMLVLDAVTSYPSQRYIQYKMTYADNKLHMHVACFAGTSDTENLFTNIGSNNACVVTHEFMTTGAQTLRIFHRDEEINFEIIRNPLSSVAAISAITGRISANLTILRLTHLALGGATGFDLSFLAPAKDSLQSLYLDRCAIVKIVPGWASSLASASYKPFTKLIYTGITYNNLTSSAIDDFINEFYNYCKVGYGYNSFTIDLSHNSISAPPTSASSTARTAFSNMKWRIITD